MKVVVGCPVFNIQDITVRQNHEFIRKTSKHTIIDAEVIGASVEHAKQIMYREFLKSDADYYFNIDADIMFLNCDKFNPIDKLIELDKDIVGGIYVYKRQPILPTFRPLDLQKIYEETGKFPEKYEFNIPEELFEVKWLSGGCMMIKREVIEKMVKKYMIPNLPMIHKGEYLSEDFAFCERAREMGYKILAEPSINLGHLGNYVYTLKDYQNKRFI